MSSPPLLSSTSNLSFSCLCTATHVVCLFLNFVPTLGIRHDTSPCPHSPAHFMSSLCHLLFYSLRVHLVPSACPVTTPGNPSPSTAALPSAFAPAGAGPPCPIFATLPHLHPTPLGCFPMSPPPSSFCLPRLTWFIAPLPPRLHRPWPPTCASARLSMLSHTPLIPFSLPPLLVRPLPFLLPFVSPPRGCSSPRAHRLLFISVSHVYGMICRLLSRRHTPTLFSARCADGGGRDGRVDGSFRAPSPPPPRPSGHPRPHKLLDGLVYGGIRCIFGPSRQHRTSHFAQCSTLSLFPVNVPETY